MQAYWRVRFEELWTHSSANFNLESGKDEEAQMPYSPGKYKRKWDIPLDAAFIDQENTSEYKITMEMLGKGVLG